MSVFVIMLSLAVETVGPDYRGIYNMLCEVVFTVIATLAPLWAYLIPNWRWQVPFSCQLMPFC